MATKHDPVIAIGSTWGPDELHAPAPPLATDTATANRGSRDASADGGRHGRGTGDPRDRLPPDPTRPPRPVSTTTGGSGATTPTDAWGSGSSDRSVGVRAPEGHLRPSEQPTVHTRQAGLGPPSTSRRNRTCSSSSCSATTSCGVMWVTPDRGRNRCGRPSASNALDRRNACAATT